MLHFDKPNPKDSSKNNEGERQDDTDDQSCVNVCAKVPKESTNNFTAAAFKSPYLSNQVRLSTAVLYVEDKQNNLVKCRALLDSGSQMNFISRNLVTKLNLGETKINVPIAGVSQMLTNINYQTKTTIKSTYNNFSANLSLFILDNITTNRPTRSFDASSLGIPPNLRLADPGFNLTAPVGLLIGAGLIFDLLCASQIKLGNQMPTLQKSVLGWLVAGP